MVTDVLWIEDAPETIGIAKAFCEKQGLNIILNSTANEVLDTLDENPKISLIIMDIQLFNVLNLECVGIENSDTAGGFDAGWVIADKIFRPKNTNDNYLNIPILMLSTRKLHEDSLTKLKELRGRGGAWINYIEKGGFDKEKKTQWVSEFHEIIKKYFPK